MDEPARILAVDDSITIRKALEMILVPEGFQVELAASGAEALEKAREFRPDLILLDFILPDMRGSDVCRALASDPQTSGVPIVLISARGAEIRQAYLDAENVLEYLVKPFTPEDVYAVVNTVLASGTEVEEVIEAPLAAAPETSAAAAPAAPAESADIRTPTFIEPPVSIDEPQPLAASGWDDGGVDADVDLDFDEPVLPSATDGSRREMFEAMFETLRAGLEGVYVEEGDTPAGAIADARSYSELASVLAQQLDETLRHATSGNRFALGGDGSIRSLDDALLDTHRRVCRLLFRAVAAGVIEGQSGSPTQPRVLVVSGSAGSPSPALAGLSQQSGWHLFQISQDFGQLPMMSRCYGPTHLIIELANKAACAQLAAWQRHGDARRMRVIGITDDTEPDAATIAQYGIATVIHDSPTLIEEVRACILRPMQREVSETDSHRPIASESMSLAIESPMEGVAL